MKVYCVQAWIDMDVQTFLSLEIIVSGGLRTLQRASGHAKLQDAEVDVFRNDKEAKKLIETNVVAENFWFVIPVFLKTGVE